MKSNAKKIENLRQTLFLKLANIETLNDLNAEMNAIEMAGVAIPEPDNASAVYGLTHRGHFDGAAEIWDFYFDKNHSRISKSEYEILYGQGHKRRFDEFYDQHLNKASDKIEDKEIPCLEDEVRFANGKVALISGYNKTTITLDMGLYVWSQKILMLIGYDPNEYKFLVFPPQTSENQKEEFINAMFGEAEYREKVENLECTLEDGTVIAEIMLRPRF